MMKSKVFSLIMIVIIIKIVAASIYFISYGYSGIIFVSNTLFITFVAILIKDLLRNQKRIMSIIVFFLLLILLFNTFKIYFITSSPKTAISFSCKKNIEKISNALKRYIEIHGKMPPTNSEKNDCAEFTDWRTAILPYFDNTDFPRCPDDDQSIYPSYIAIVGENTVWKDDGFFFQTNNTSLAILIEVNNKFNVQRNEFGDVYLNDILSGDINNNFFCKTHFSTDIFFRDSTFRVLMQNGEILYFYDPPSIELLRKLFVLHQFTNSLSEYHYSKDFNYRIPVMGNIILACVYYVLIILSLSLSRAYPQLSLSNECPQPGK